MSNKIRKRIDYRTKRLGIGKGWAKGSSLSEEHRKKISLAHMGKKKPMSEETKIKLSKIGKGRKLSLETRLKHSLRLRGEKSHFWKGGLTPINLAIRRSLTYRLWREEVFKRDNWTC